MPHELCMCMQQQDCRASRPPEHALPGIRGEEVLLLRLQQRGRLTGGGQVAGAAPPSASRCELIVRGRWPAKSLCMCRSL
jgi:hypothetical protein